MVRGAAVGVGVGAGMTAGSAAMASVLSPKEKALAEKCERTSYYKDHQKLCDELPK